MLLLSSSSVLFEPILDLGALLEDSNKCIECSLITNPHICTPTDILQPLSPLSRINIQFVYVSTRFILWQTLNFITV